MSFSGSVAVRAMKAGDFVATIFPGTAAGLQQALDFAGLLGEVRVGPGTITDITNLTMYGKCLFSGSGALNTLLVRSAGATGTMLREKTTAEGNASGATGIIVRDLGFYGNATGNGIDLGNAGGASFNANAYLSDILVRDFTTGFGIKLLANAIHVRDIWAANCSIGVWLNYNSGGGANHIDGIWSEQCSDTHLKVEQPWNTFVHVQIEQSGSAPTNPLIDLAASTADRNVFCGVYCSMATNLTNLITCRTGVVGSQFYGIRVNANGHTYTNTVYTEGTGTGTGAQDWIGFFNDMSNSGKHYFNDQTSGEVSSFTGARPTFPVATVTTLNATTAAITGTLTQGVAGTGNSATFGQGATGADSSTVRARSGTGGIAQFLLNQNNVDLAGLRVASSLTFLDHIGTFAFRNGISGPQTATLDTSGNLASIGGMTIAGIRTDHRGSDIASAATISIPVDGDVFHVTGNTNITNGITVNAVDAGRTVYLIFDGTPTVSDTGTSKLNGAFVATADDTLTLKCDGTSWFEIGRSPN